MAGLFRQRHRDRFNIHHRLAAKRTANFSGMATQIAGFHAEQLGRHGAHHEMTLAGRPDFGLPVGIGARQTRVRLDVALMHRRGFETHFDDFFGGGKTRRHIADFKLDFFGDIRRLGRRRLDAARNHVLEQQRGVGFHRVFDVDHMRQHFVIDFDQLQRLGGNRRRGRGNRSQRVSFVQHFFTRHDVARHVPEILRHALRAEIFKFVIRQIGRRNHAFDARQFERLAGVNFLDACMRVRRTQDFAPQHARQVVVSAVLRGAGKLGYAVRTIRAGADDLEFLFGYNCAHD